MWTGKDCTSDICAPYIQYHACSYIHSVYPQTGGGGREGLTLPPRDPLLSVSHSFSSRLQPEHYRRLLGSTSRTSNSNNNTTSSLLAIDREPSSPDQQSLEHHDSSSDSGDPHDSGDRSQEEEEEEEEESGRERRQEPRLEESGGVRYRGRGRSRQRGLGEAHAVWLYYSTCDIDQSYYVRPTGDSSTAASSLYPPSVATEGANNLTEKEEAEVKHIHNHASLPRTTPPIMKPTKLLVKWCCYR